MEHVPYLDSTGRVGICQIVAGDLLVLVEPVPIIGGPGILTPDGADAYRRGWGAAVEYLVGRWRELEISGEMAQRRAAAVAEETAGILELIEEVMETPSPETAIEIARRLGVAEDAWAIGVAKATIDVRDDHVAPAVEAADRFIEYAGEAAGQVIGAVGRAADSAATVLKIATALGLMYGAAQVVRALKD